MSEAGKLTVAQAAPAAQDEACEGKDVERRRRESRVRKAFWMCTAVAIFGSLPCAISLTVPETADGCWPRVTNFEDPSIDRVATDCHREGFRLPNAEGQWDGGETATGSEDATAERWRRDSTAVQGTDALARTVGVRDGGARKC